MLLQSWVRSTILSEYASKYATKVDNTPFNHHLLLVANGLRKELPEHVDIIYQHHGDAIHLAAGTIHSVLNLRPNIKLAFDRCHIRSAPTAALVRERILVPFFANRMPLDYNSVAHHSARMALNGIWQASLHKAA